MEDGSWLSDHGWTWFCTAKPRIDQEKISKTYSVLKTGEYTGSAKQMQTKVLSSSPAE
jgi:hypothetical protein